MVEIGELGSRGVEESRGRLIQQGVEESGMGMGIRASGSQALETLGIGGVGNGGVFFFSFFFLHHVTQYPPWSHDHLVSLVWLAQHPLTMVSLYINPIFLSRVFFV